DCSIAHPVSLQRGSEPRAIHSVVSKCVSLTMKTTRGPRARSRSFRKLDWCLPRFRTKCFGVRRVLASLFSCLALRFLQLLSDFAFFATNILQMALEKRKLRFLRGRMVEQSSIVLTTVVCWPWLLRLTDLEKQFVFLFLKLSITCLQSLSSIYGGLLSR